MVMEPIIIRILAKFIIRKFDENMYFRRYS